MKGKPTVENRRFKRYRVKEGVYAVLRDNGTRKMGTMLDISRGGLSYQYVPENSTENGTFQLDIFMAGEGFRAKALPFRQVTDLEIDQNIPFSSIPVRRSGVEFGSLSDAQLAQVEAVITNDTVPCVH